MYSPRQDWIVGSPECFANVYRLPKGCCGIYPFAAKGCCGISICSTHGRAVCRRAPLLPPLRVAVPSSFPDPPPHGWLSSQRQAARRSPRRSSTRSAMRLCAATAPTTPKCGSCARCAPSPLSHGRGAFSPGSAVGCRAARAFRRALCESVLLSCPESVLLSCSNAWSWPSRSRTVSPLQCTGAEPAVLSPHVCAPAPHSKLAQPAR